MRARVILCLLALSALAFPGFAEDRRGQPSLDRVLPEIRRSNPGTFYDAEGPFIGPNGQASYRIKWMTPEGRIIWFYADAHTGQVYGRGGMPYGSFPPRNGDDYGSGRFRNRSGWPDAGSGGGGGGYWRDRGGREWNDRGGHDWNDRGGRGWNGRGGRDNNGRGGGHDWNDRGGGGSHGGGHGNGKHGG